LARKPSAAFSQEHEVGEKGQARRGCRARQPSPYLGCLVRGPCRRLDTLARIRRKVVTLYREAREGELDASDASKLDNWLVQTGKLIADAEIEARITALEKGR
jgi:hypothetical protein